MTDLKDAPAAKAALATAERAGPLGYGMPPSVVVADLEFAARRANLLRAWALNFRHRLGGALPAWDDGAKAALRHIAAGMAIFADGTAAFGSDDWALYSGLPPASTKKQHQDEFVKLVDGYLDTLHVFAELGTEDLPGKPRGDYDFVLSDVIALIHTFLDQPLLLTNSMIRKLICHGRSSPWGIVPFAGQNLDAWLGEGPGGRHYFRESIKVLGIQVAVYKLAMPETENHLLGIYAWRYLVNEYLEYVAGLPAGHDRHDPELAALVAADQDRYINRAPIRDFVMQLLGRIPHSGTFESNAKPYSSITTQAVMTFYQAAGRLFPDDPERARVRTAAQNALDYLAAEFAFQSLEGKRMPPSRRNDKRKWNVSFHASDYLANVFGILTGAYAYSDDNGASGTEPSFELPYHWASVDQNAGFALWSVLSGYRVPRAVHGFMLNKHGGYQARIVTRYSSRNFPFKLNYLVGPIGDAVTPSIQRPRYFQAVSSGEQTPGEYDVAAGGIFRPVPQLFFATADYLNSSGGLGSDYFDPDIPVLPDELADTFAAEKLHSNDVLARPSSLILRGNLQIENPDDVGAMEALIPLMRGKDEFFYSLNFLTWKSLSLGYTFDRDDDDRHLDWPQRFPQWWLPYKVEQPLGIGRASIHVYDFTEAPEHPLYGHYWVLAQFSKSDSGGQFREYGRGLWEVVPGHRFANPDSLIAHIKNTNPDSHFDDNPANHYKWRMPSTGELVEIHNKFGSTASVEGILKIFSREGDLIPLQLHSVDLEPNEDIRGLPLMSVWQVDRDHEFTGRAYAHADGHGRMHVHNPFLGHTLTIDSSDYRAPTRSTDESAVRVAPLPDVPGTEGQSPAISAVAAGTGVIYVTRYFETNPPSQDPPLGYLLAVDPGTLETRASVTVGKRPISIGVHHETGRVYVVNYGGHDFSVVDGASHTVVTTVPCPGSGLRSVVVSQQHHRVFIAQYGQKRILVFDGATLEQLPAIADLPLDGDLAFDEASQQLHALVLNAADPARQDLIVFQVTEDGHQELGRTTMDGQVSKPSKVAFDSDQLYVLNDGERPGHGPGQKLTIVDRETLAVTAVVPLITGSAMDLAVSESQRVVYVLGNSGVLVVDTHTAQVVHKLPLHTAPAGGIAADSRTGAVWYGAGNANVIYGPSDFS